MASSQALGERRPLPTAILPRPAVHGAGTPSSSPQLYSADRKRPETEQDNEDLLSLTSARGRRGGQRDRPRDRNPPHGTQPGLSLPNHDRQRPRPIFESNVPCTLHRTSRESPDSSRTHPAVRAREGPATPGRAGWGRAGDPRAARVEEGPGSRGGGEPGKVREGRGGARESPRAPKRVRDTRPAAPPPHHKSRPARAPTQPVDRHPESTLNASASVRSSRPRGCGNPRQDTHRGGAKAQDLPDRAADPPSARRPPGPRPAPPRPVSGWRHHVDPLPCQRCPRPGATWPASLPTPTRRLSSAQAQTRPRFPPLRRRRAPPTAVGHIEAGGGGGGQA